MDEEERDRSCGRPQWKILFFQDLLSLTGCLLWFGKQSKTHLLKTLTIFNFCHLVPSDTKTWPSHSAALPQLNTKSYKPFLLSEATLCQQALKAQRMTPITKMYWPGSCRQTRKRKLATGRQTGSLFSSLFQDKYLISGTLMGIDWSLHPLFIDPSWLWSLLRWTHTHTYTQSCNPWMSNQNERLKA